jgi:hypothetical protein
MQARSTAPGDPTEPGAAAYADSPTPPPHDDIAATLARWARWARLTDELDDLLHDPFGRTGFPRAVGRCAREVTQLTLGDPDLAIFLLIYPTQAALKRYSVLHALHTALLMALVGRRKDWSDARILSGVSAALTMNLSITRLQIDLALQIDPLTAAQRQTIHHHPVASATMLRQLGVTDEDWVTAVLQHHEQTDGKGYPLGLDQIDMLADALHTCDVFGAKVSPRANRGALPSPRAAKDIFRQRSAGYFGATLIHELGLYPPGTLVSLADGEQAVVLHRTHDPHAPVVAVIHDAQGQPLQRPQRATTGRLGLRVVRSALAVQTDAVLPPPEDILGAL